MSTKSKKGEKQNTVDMSKNYIVCQLEIWKTLSLLRMTVKLKCVLK